MRPSPKRRSPARDVRARRRRRRRPTTRARWRGSGLYRSSRGTPGTREILTRRGNTGSGSRGDRREARRRPPRRARRRRKASPLSSPGETLRFFCISRVISFAFPNRTSTSCIDYLNTKQTFHDQNDSQNDPVNLPHDSRALALAYVGESAVASTDQSYGAYKISIRLFSFFRASSLTVFASAVTDVNVNSAFFLALPRGHQSATRSSISASDAPKSPRYHEKSLERRTVVLFVVVFATTSTLASSSQNPSAAVCNASSSVSPS
mmetsp:Transcript_9679/g.40581  ORF Transcript_9679/g.40581 Transcript_9679/m.40581 type:complete len:264 (+) Transcript_9679:350-1141(+)